MGKLIFVRHAQASYFKEDYDQLSELGIEQARALADYWLKFGQGFDRVYQGSLKRHQQTTDILGKTYNQAGQSFPQPEVLPGLNESRAWDIVKYFLPKLEPEAAELQAYMQGKGPLPREKMQQFARVYKRISYMWVRDELNEAEAGFETWAAFRNRVNQAVLGIASEIREGESVLVITSGGPIGVAVGLALDLANEKALELSWFVQNTSLTKFRAQSESLSLRSFNAVPHLQDQRLLTYV
ncbi:MAG: histidine phosphatase family protein [candidate division KSB1 bacterium]|nr:histidine phosphatase family protein [candidate division KSB1 bacterium]MDQ7064237.1 histidine phosphatase family protein [candidate division KSB1 bacterium]